MKIVLIAPFATRPKGTTRARVLPLARALASRGHQVTVLIPPWDAPDEAGREEAHASLRIRWLSLPRRALVPRLSLHLAREALRARPDLIHVFKPKAHAGLALLWLWLRRTSIPLLLDSDDWEGRGGWNEVNPYTRAQKAFFQWQETFLPRRCARVVTVVSRTLQTQMWGLGLPPERVVYLPNGVDRHRYASWEQADPVPLRRRLGLNGHPAVLLYTRFDRFALGRAVEVLAHVAQELPEVRFLVVGRGFFGEENALQREMAGRGLEKHLLYAGWVSEEELPAYLAAGDVAYYPMDDTLINRASFSIKLLELLVAGRPVVTDAVGENREVLEDRRSGWLTLPGDTVAQAEALITLLRSPEMRRSLGEAARRRVWQKYDWDRLVERAEAAYRLAGDLSAGPS
ncbi:MAG: glycosyltransferase family 4 protein [Chloroflexia bacterium]